MLQPKTYIQYNYSRIRNVLIFVFFFWFLKSVWGRTGHQNRWKWHFYCFVLLFLMIHGSSRRILQFIAASFGVWGYRNRFLRSIMNVIQDSWITQVKKKIWNHLWNSLWATKSLYFQWYSGPDIKTKILSRLGIGRSHTGKGKSHSTSTTKLKLTHNTLHNTTVYRIENTANPGNLPVCLCWQNRKYWRSIPN